MALSDVGQMVQDTWQQMLSHYPGCGLDAFVVMPDHFRGIILVTASTGQAQGRAPTPMSLSDWGKHIASVGTGPRARPETKQAAGIA